MEFLQDIFANSQTDLGKLVMAILVGGLIGAEREYRDKASGFRTTILICVGAALFMMFSLKVGGGGDPARIAAQIVSGIGFLGAGAILRDGANIKGLTTATTIWLTAALGMGIGGGFYAIVIMAALGVLVVLWLFPTLEIWIDNRRELRTYYITYNLNPEKAKAIEALFKGSELTLFDSKQFKHDGAIVSEWLAQGSPADHDRLVTKLFADADIKTFRY